LIVASALPPGQSAQPGVSLADALVVAQSNINKHNPNASREKQYLMVYLQYLMVYLSE
jgi:hypothetical protein